MRGTAAIPRGKEPRRRFIPAHAGNSMAQWGRQTASAVHPRACGEQRDLMTHADGWNGSSPRMRGTGAWNRSHGAMGRFIPAHAGNSIGKPTRGGTTTVHPRACGEQKDSQGKDRIRIGSSPRMRGTGYRPASLGSAGRFIPAHAGNRRRWIGAMRPLAVHPRACGEQTSWKLLIYRYSSKTEESTNYPASLRGKNETSFSPSKSTGMRRLRPAVSKA